MASRVETVRGIIGLALEGISDLDGYNTQVKGVYYVPIHLESQQELPVISVLPGKERIAYIDGASKSVSHSLIDFAVIGYIGGDTGSITEAKLMNDNGEPLLHDIKKVLATLINSDINETVAWQIIAPEGETAFTVERFLIPGMNKGFVGVRFTVQIFAQDNSF